MAKIEFHILPGQANQQFFTKHVGLRKVRPKLFSRSSPLFEAMHGSGVNIEALSDIRRGFGLKQA